MSRISESTSKLTHVTYTDIDSFVIQLDFCRGAISEKVVNNVILEDYYVLSFVDEYKSLYHRLVLRNFKDYDFVLRELVKRGYLVVVV